jgi:hypothetical protein
VFLDCKSLRDQLYHTRRREPGMTPRVGRLTCLVVKGRRNVSPFKIDKLMIIMNETNVEHGI